MTASAVLREVFYRAWDCLHFLAGNGSWRLNETERLVIEAAVGMLSDSVQDLVGKQLRQRFFVERMSGGRINVLRFYAPDSALTIEEIGFADRLVVVTILVNGRQQEAHVVLVRGYVFSVEFKDGQADAAGRPLRVLNVKAGVPGQSYTNVIDRSEHDSGS